MSRIEEVENRIEQLENSIENREITIDRLESEKRNEEWLLNFDVGELNTLRDELKDYHDGIADESWDGETDGFLEEQYENAQFEGCDEMYGSFSE